MLCDIITIVQAIFLHYIIRNIVSFFCPSHQATAAVVQPRRIKEDYYTLSLVLTVIWLILCAPYLLCCTIPALFLAKSVSPIQQYTV